MRAVCQFRIHGGKHNETPTDKRTHPSRDILETSGPPPPLLGRKEGTLKAPRDSLKKNINQENPTWLEGRDHNDATTGPDLRKLSA